MKIKPFKYFPTGFWNPSPTNSANSVEVIEEQVEPEIPAIENSLEELPQDLHISPIQNQNLSGLVYTMTISNTSNRTAEEIIPHQAPIYGNSSGYYSVYSPIYTGTSYIRNTELYNSMFNHHSYLAPQNTFNLKPFKPIVKKLSYETNGIKHNHPLTNIFADKD